MQGSESDKSLSGLLSGAGRSLLRYVRGQVVIALLMTGLYAVGFYFIGVPLWWLLALLCGPFHLVPMLGAVLSAVIPVAALVIAGRGFRQILLVLLLYGAIQLIETFYLTPKILGHELRLSPLVVLASVLAGALVFGPVGALVAAPLVALFLFIYRQFVKLEKEKPDQSDD